MDTGGSQAAGAGQYVPNARASGAWKRIDTLALLSGHMPPRARIPLRTSPSPDSEGISSSRGFAMPMTSHA
jgi:hypothetical protein